MSESNSRSEAGARNGKSPGDELEELRDLLLAPEKAQLAGLRGRMDDTAVQTEQVSRVLPAALRLACERNGQLADALGPSVETALKNSVRRDPTVLTEAIFPVIGPAIRKAIAEAMRKLTESLNQTLEQTLSAQSFKWRIEARRTGKSFSEIVLARTLVYRVEQVFLIHKETGLLLQHVHRIGDPSGPDADMISGMFTAIQDFARDSFGVSEGEGLETMQVGELTVWIESSPRMTLAAVIRGSAPQDLRPVLQCALERIHGEQKPVLDSFTGDPAPFEVVRPCLEDCLRVQRAERIKKQRSNPGRVAAVLLLAGAIAWGIAAAHERRERLTAENRRQAAALAANQAKRDAEAVRWNGFVQKAKSIEGVVITEAGHREGRYYLAGLRDPLALDPAKLLADSGFDSNQVVLRWEPYQALSPGLVLKRVRRRLNPPASVSLQLRGEVLVAAGSAAAAWLASSRWLAETMPGITEFDASQVVDDTAAFVEAKKLEIQKTFIAFAQGSALAPGQEGTLDRLAQQINELHRTTAAAGQTLRISVIGHTSGQGTETFNTKLSTERAAAVIALLIARSVPASELVPIAAGARELLTDAPEAANRRVTFDVMVSGSSTPQLPP